MKRHQNRSTTGRRTTSRSAARPRCERCRSLPVVLAAAAGIFLAGPATGQPAAAAAAPYPPPGCSEQLSSTVVQAGQQISVTGNCFAPGSQVTVQLDTTVLTTVAADASGVAKATVTIPSSTTLGTHQISMSGLGSSGIPLTETASITVVFGLTAESRPVPHHGFPLLPAAVSTAAALLGGGAFLRRRRAGRR